MWYTIFHVKNQHTLTFMRLLPAVRDFCSILALNLLPKRLNFNLPKPNLFKYFGLKIINPSYTKLVMKSCSFHSFLLSHWHNTIFLNKAKKSQQKVSIKVCVIPNDLKREKKKLKKEKKETLKSFTAVIRYLPWGLKQVFLVDWPHQP